MSKHKKEDDKKPHHKFGSGLKKAFGKIAHPFAVLLDVAIAPGKLAAFAPLAPFVAVMQTALKKKNVKVPGSKLDYPENLARQFYQVVIRKEPPFTKGVGLASKHSLESVDAGDAAKAAVGTAADAAVDMAAKNISSAGLVGSLAGTAIQIIHGIIHFLTANKKKAANQTAKVPVPLTPEEQAVSGDTLPDHELAAHTDKVQDILVSAGVGNVKADGTHIPDVPDYGHGVGAFFRKLLHIPLHKQNLEALLESLEELDALEAIEA
jgi:membrane-associated protease RseP (regulator of RpoE activity)